MKGLIIFSSQQTFLSSFSSGGGGNSGFAARPHKWIHFLPKGSTQQQQQALLKRGMSLSIRSGFVFSSSTVVNTTTKLFTRGSYTCKRKMSQDIQQRPKTSYNKTP